MSEMELDEAHAEYTRAGLAVSSRLTYQTGQRAWLLFCDVVVKMPVDEVIVNERLLDNFVCWLAKIRNVSGETISNYLSHVRSFYVDAGMANKWPEIKNLHGLNRTIRGISFVHASKNPKRRRDAITCDIMIRLGKVMTNPAVGRDLDVAMLWAAITLAFACLLRSDEYCRKQLSKEVSTDPPKLGSLKFLFNEDNERKDEIGLSFFIPQSKTDQLMRGHTVYSATLSHVFCPVKMKTYLNLRSELLGQPGVDSWLFIGASGDPLSYEPMRKSLKIFLVAIGEVAENFGTHSLRIGGATFLGRCNVSNEKIKAMGRWNSSCFEVYVRISPEDILRTSFLMLNMATNK